ncbi:MAG: proline--tRNA ligase [Anaerolineae bacterium]|nr:proline--tRNA ligase [Anaerolineae bacterium]
MSVQKLPSHSQDFSDWYNEIIMRAELADTPPRVPEQLRGFMVLRPYGYALWENLQAALDAMFKATGHKNAYFPVLIPMSFIAKEKDHVEGFKPELAVVTHGGGEELTEPLVVRPTSETVIGHMYAQWIRTYRDLPVLINQWGSVLRWEKRTRAFMRTAEFLWQEGHTAHATEEEAEAETLQMLEIYRILAEDWAAVPVLTGRKSESEKFAGALRTYTIESLMPDGRALQSGTSHNLGQNFARAFDIQYQDRDNTLKYCWTTSWGLSWRMLGALIGLHGDDKGLKFPPKLAPIQVVIVPIYRSDEERAAVMGAVDHLKTALSGVRLEVDDREGLTPGFKFNDWEMRGVPIRIELGPRDVAGRVAVVARRDIPDKSGKESVGWDSLGETVQARLADIQAGLFRTAQERRARMTFTASSWDEFMSLVPESGGFGFIRAYWAGDDADEAWVKQAAGGVTIRAFPFDQPTEPGRCIRTGKETTQVAVFARAY